MQHYFTTRDGVIIAGTDKASPAERRYAVVSFIMSEIFGIALVAMAAFFLFASTELWSYARILSFEGVGNFEFREWHGYITEIGFSLTLAALRISHNIKATPIKSTAAFLSAMLVGIMFVVSPLIFIPFGGAWLFIAAKEGFVNVASPIVFAWAIMLAPMPFEAFINRNG